MFVSRIYRFRGRRRRKVEENFRVRAHLVSRARTQSKSRARMQRFRGKSGKYREKQNRREENATGKITRSFLSFVRSPPICERSFATNNLICFFLGICNNLCHRQCRQPANHQKNMFCTLHQVQAANLRQKQAITNRESLYQRSTPVTFKPSTSTSTIHSDGTITKSECSQKLFRGMKHKMVW